MKKKSFLFLSVLLAVLMLFGTASADKARYLATDGNTYFHSQHLTLHIGMEDCRVCANYLKVRARASSSAQVIGHVEQADLVQLIAVDGDWAQICVLYRAPTSPDSYIGLYGWVNASYLECGCSERSYYAGGRDPITGGVTTTGGLNLRELPASNSRSLTQLPRGESVRVMGQYYGGGKIYYRIARQNGQNGFVSSEYLSAGSAAPIFGYSGNVSPSRPSGSSGSYGSSGSTGSYGSLAAGEVRTTSSSLRVRETPNGTVIGHIASADRITLLETSGNWARITVTAVGSGLKDVWVGLTGWVSMDFLVGVSGSSGVSAPSGAGYSGGYNEAAVDNGWTQVLNRYYDAIRTGNQDVIVEPSGVSFNNASYLFRDLDGDGDPELLVLSSGGDTDVLACYTRKNGSIFHVFDGWGRNRYSLRSDGSFYNAGSNGADNSIECVLRLSGTQLRVVMAVYCQGSNWYYTEDQRAYDAWGDLSVDPLSLGARLISDSEFSQYSRMMESSVDRYPSDALYFRDYLR